MAVSERQFTLLNEMGIQLWQRRALTRSSTSFKSTSQSINVTAKHNTSNKEVTLDLEQLSKNVLFNDIIKSLSISIGEVSCLNNVLNLGLINWQFDHSDDISTISLQNNLLTTPKLALIAQSSKLKRQLWQTIQTQDIS